MALYNLLYKVTTGPVSTRRILTLLALITVPAVLAAIIVGGVALDRWLALPRLLPRGPGIAVGVPLILAGALFSGWSVLVFLRGRGTPVPFNPPPALVVRGPYAHSRNPMISGLFFMLFGLGFLFGSISLALIVTPVFVVLGVIGLKLVEEPELEKRLGAPYVEYRRRTPMFLPRWKPSERRDSS